MLEQISKAAKAASWQLAVLTSAQKDSVLLSIADSLEDKGQSILDANPQDIAEAHRKSLGEALLDRLLLNPARLSAIAAEVPGVPSHRPGGQVIDGQWLASGRSL